MKLLKKDSRGLAFSFDMLLALIPITLVLGLVAANMGNIMYDTQDLVYRSSAERAAQDTTNALLKTSGDPYNWEALSSSQVKSIGMAKYDPQNKLPREYVLSVDKVGAVTPSMVQNILGNQYSFQMLITTPVVGGDQRTIINMTSGGNTKTKDTASDVVAVERIVTISEFEIVAELYNVRLTGQPITLTEYFPTNKAYLDVFDYYVYVDNADLVSSGWAEINGVSGNERVIPTSAFPIPAGSPPYLVRKIDPVTHKLKNETDLQMNKIETRLAGSPGDTADVYVIRVPKGTPIEKITPENVKGVKSKFVLYVWLR